MPLYFVEHHHTAETCPTQQPEMMQMLGKHVTQPNADTYGITIQADVVHPGEHRMNMVLVAARRSPSTTSCSRSAWSAPYRVKEVTTCEQVVATAKC